MKTAVLSLFVLSLHSLFAQTEVSLVGTGYSAPAPIEVAPGQVMTLFFRGVGPLANGTPRRADAQIVPLPATLAGLSAYILQAPRAVPVDVPILSVRQHNDCEEVTLRPVCTLTQVRVQIPFELTPTVCKLVLKEDGQLSRTFLLRPIRDNAHIITSCDLIWDTNPGSACAKLAYHADGRLVDEKTPARRGETIVIYAHGLGVTLPRAATGLPSPAGANVIEATSRQIKVGFESPRGYSETAPLFVGLTETQVGLYQINVTIPPSLELSVRCGGETRSNVLAKITTSRGVENLPLCVE